MKLKYFIFLFVLLSCNKMNLPVAGIESYIPENSKVILKINNLSKFSNNFLNNKYLNNLNNSKTIIAKILSVLENNIFEDKVVICIYYDDQIMFNIISENISVDNITDLYVYKDRNFTIISNNDKIEVKEKNENHLYKKFTKIDQNNTNFSISFDSKLSTELINEIFNISVTEKDENLHLNINATNNVVYFNGVIDNNFESIINNSNELVLEELEENTTNFYFNKDQDLTEDFDLINTNLKDSINILKFIKVKPLIKNFKIFQLKKGINVSFINGLISGVNNSENKNFKNNYELKFKNKILVGPIIVKNHFNDDNEIIVQDNNNVIYLINNKGQIEWSMKIDGKILKEIHQIDSYKNGELHYLFSTKKKLYLLNREGINIDNFPKEFDNEITKPISVFDYDNNKNYRILLTQKNKLLMLNSKGVKINGFNYDFKTEIITSPKHFRILNKDIIVFKTEKELRILDRKGNIRILPEKKIEYSQSPIFKKDEVILTTSNKNEIVEINLQGKIKIKQNNSDIKLNTFDNSVVIFKNNIVSIKEKKIELKFGNYNKLQIHKNDYTNFLSIYDSQKNEVYLFNDKLDIIDGFPKKCLEHSRFGIKKNIIEFAYKADEKTIIFTKKTI